MTLTDLLKLAGAAMEISTQSDGEARVALARACTGERIAAMVRVIEAQDEVIEAVGSKRLAIAHNNLRKARAALDEAMTEAEFQAALKRYGCICEDITVTDLTEADARHFYLAGWNAATEAAARECESRYSNDALACAAAIRTIKREEK